MLTYADVLLTYADAPAFFPQDEGLIAPRQARQLQAKQARQEPESLPSVSSIKPPAAWILEVENGGGASAGASSVSRRRGANGSQHASWSYEIASSESRMPSGGGERRGEEQRRQSSLSSSTDPRGHLKNIKNKALGGIEEVAYDTSYGDTSEEDDWHIRVMRTVRQWADLGKSVDGNEHLHIFPEAADLSGPRLALPQAYTGAQEGRRDAQGRMLSPHVADVC
jgi:hypothetical protein